MSLVPTSSTHCPVCVSLLVSLTWHEDALVRHAGYGGTRTTVVVRCSMCQYVRSRDRLTTRPPR